MLNRSRLKYATPAFLAVLFALVAIELLIRLTMVDFFSGRYQYGFDEESGFLESSNGTVQFVRAGGRRFYEQSIQRVKPEKTFRIITVGDSIARGASLQEAYPAVLGEQLRERGYRVESINLAVPGFGARRQQIVLRRALRYSPDLIIFHFGMSNEFEDERDWGRAEQASGHHPRNWPMKSYLIARLHEYKTDQITPKFLPEKIRLMSAMSDAEDEASANRDPARVAAWQRSFARTFGQSLDLIKAAKVPALLIPRVEVRGSGDRISFDDSGLRALLADRLGGAVHWLNPAELFGVHPDLALFAKDRVHWHPPAHQLAAQVLAERLIRGAGPEDTGRAGPNDGDRPNDRVGLDGVAEFPELVAALRRAKLGESTR